MGTTTRPELSGKNQYWIEKHRYYELKHFCLQYPIWEKAYEGLDGLNKTKEGLDILSKTNNITDLTFKCVEAKLFYSEKMDMVKQAAIDTNHILSSYILKAVTEGLSYDHLKNRMGVPCCKGMYYELYRQFFWNLNKLRQ